MSQFQETHKIVTVTHELNVDGHILREIRLKSEIGEIGEDKKTIVEHTREIDDRSYKVTETKIADEPTPDRQVETTMDDEQVKEFMTMWEDLWSPRLSAIESISMN